MNSCIDPRLIKEGDLIAYVDGEAEGWLREHVDCCPTCASKVTQLRKASQGLLEHIYRASCPEPERWGQYHFNFLSSQEELVMAAHLRTCLHCTQELQTLTTLFPLEPEDSLIEMVKRLFQDTVKVIETSLMPSRRLRPARVRKRARQRDTQTYHADGLNVLLDFQPLTREKESGRLLGSVLLNEIGRDSQAWLFEEGKRPFSTPIDDRGTFIFEKIRHGHYDLALEMEKQAILLREVMLHG